MWGTGTGTVEGTHCKEASSVRGHVRYSGEGVVNVWCDKKTTYVYILYIYIALLQEICLFFVVYAPVVEYI